MRHLGPAYAFLSLFIVGAIIAFLGLGTDTGP